MAVQLRDHSEQLLEQLDQAPCSARSLLARISSGTGTGLPVALSTHTTMPSPVAATQFFAVLVISHTCVKLVRPTFTTLAVTIIVSG